MSVSSAALIANAATRSAIEGSSFERNIIAAIPDVIAQAMSDLVAHGISLPKQQVAADPVASGSGAFGFDTASRGEFGLGSRPISRFGPGYSAFAGLSFTEANTIQHFDPEGEIMGVLDQVMSLGARTVESIQTFWNEVRGSDIIVERTRQWFDAMFPQPRDRAVNASLQATLRYAHVDDETLSDAALKALDFHASRHQRAAAVG